MNLHNKNLQADIDIGVVADVYRDEQERFLVSSVSDLLNTKGKGDS